MLQAWWKRVGVIAVCAAVAAVCALAYRPAPGPAQVYAGAQDGAVVQISLYTDADAYQEALPRYTRTDSQPTQHKGEYIGWIVLPEPVAFSDALTVHTTFQQDAQDAMLFPDQDGPQPTASSFGRASFLLGYGRDDGAPVRVTVHKNGRLIADVPVQQQPLSAWRAPDALA